jgi:ketosteroid isomerase-like protein
VYFVHKILSTHKIHNMHDTDQMESLRRLEAERCRALLEGDRKRLAQLLHRDLIHVHAKGQIDTYESYFAGGGFKVDYRRVERGELKIRVTGDVALMTGRQLLEAERKASGERIRIDSQVMQVWVRAGVSWQQVAFQTTPTEFTVVAANAQEPRQQP